MCYRHLYIPIVEMGYGKTTASVVVFFISAFFHEYLVSVPLKTFKIWAFMGMMGQVSAPHVYLVYVVDRANIDYSIKKFSDPPKTMSLYVASMPFKILAK